jgi:DNA-binding NtrC family response regulator
VKILIIDDEQLDLFISKKLLGIEFEIEGFTDLRQAKAWAEKNHFDVVLTDYYLENVLAHEVLKQLKEVRKEKFKALVVSNHIDSQVANQLKAEGFAAILEKPITMEKFKEAISIN